MPPLCSALRSRQLGQGARPDGGPALRLSATEAGTGSARDEAAASAARAARSEIEPGRC